MNDFGGQRTVFDSEDNYAHRMAKRCDAQIPNGSDTPRSHRCRNPYRYEIKERNGDVRKVCGTHLRPLVRQQNALEVLPAMKELIERIDALYGRTTEKPWAWWNTGDKDNGWQIGVMVDHGLDGATLVGGDQSADMRDEDDPEPVVITDICENWGGNSGATLADPALIVELVNAWPTIRAALMTADARTAGQS